VYVALYGTYPLHSCAIHTQDITQHLSLLYRIEHLHTALAQGTLILTPNRRIAEKIKQA